MKKIVYMCVLNNQHFRIPVLERVEIRVVWSGLIDFVETAPDSMTSMSHRRKPRLWLPSRKAKTSGSWLHFILYNMLQPLIVSRPRQFLVRVSKRGSSLRKQSVLKNFFSLSLKKKIMKKWVRKLFVKKKQHQC